MKKVTVAIALGLICAITLSLAGFDLDCQKLRDNVFRLHIIANSDSEADQKLKLRVRDSLIELSGQMFSDCTDYQSAVKIADTNIEKFELTANEIVGQYGYKAKVSVGPAKFGTRHYDSVTLPAGEYTALKVEIGEAKGRNWWCVMFPQMCLPAANEKSEISKSAGNDGAEIAGNYTKYKFKFKLVEWIEGLR